MYWSNLEKLSADLVAERLTEQDRFAYYLATTVWIVLAAAVPWIMLACSVTSDPAYAWSSITDVIISGLIMMFGVWCWYLANGGSHGRNFLERVTAMTWVVGFRLLRYSLPVLVALSLTTMDIIVNQPWYEKVYPILDAISTWFSTLWTIIFVLWVRLCLRDIHLRSLPPTPET